MRDPADSGQPPGQSRAAFLKAFLRDRRTIGAVAPTSSAVGRRMARMAGVESARAVAEFGPGTGAITRELLTALPADAALYAFEVYPPFVAQLQRTVRDPRLRVIPQSAEAIASVRPEAASPGFDAVVSSVPFSLIGAAGTRVILRAAHEALRSGGVFVALQYHPRFLAPFLRAEFGNLERRVYAWNIPPVLLLRARNDSTA